MAAMLLCTKVLSFPLKSCLVSQDMARFLYCRSKYSITPAYKFHTLLMLPKLATELRGA